MTAPSRFTGVPPLGPDPQVMMDAAVADLAALDVIDVHLAEGYRVNAGFQRDVVREANVAPFHELLHEDIAETRRRAVQRVLVDRARERGLPVDAPAAVEALDRLFPGLGRTPAASPPRKDRS